MTGAGTTVGARHLPDQRGLFDLPPSVTYLDCAYIAPQLRSVTEVGQRAVTRKAHPWEIRQEDFFAGADQLRERFATLVNGDADGVAIMPSVSYGISTAAAQVDPDRDGEIIVLADQFPSNVYPWRELAEQSSLRVRPVARPADDDWTSALLEVIGRSTAVVAVPPCHWIDGTVVDLEQVGAAAREVGAMFVVDATQSVGAVPFDVSTVEPDVLVTAAYKWLLGPYSIALAWFHPRQRHGRPIEHSWMTRADSQDFSRLTVLTDEYRPGARRYDVGETSDFVLVPMATAAVDQLLTWQIERVTASCRRLTDAVAEAGQELGMTVPAPAFRSPHLIGLRLPDGLDSQTVAASLRASDIHVSVRGRSIRVSPHVYNDFDDVARLSETLRNLT